LKDDKEIDLVLKRSGKGLVFYISLTLLILLLESALQLSQPRHSDQRPYELIGNSFASNTNSIPIDNLDGIVTSITDGDTLVIRTNEGDVMTIRLALVDAPETNELGYKEAKDFVSKHCFGQPATIDPDNNQDLSYGRLVALVYCDDLNINEAVIASGFADIYRSFCGISEFGKSAWAQNYGCDAENVESPNSRISEEPDVGGDDEEEKISTSCDSAYSGVCIPPPPPDLDCKDIPDKNFNVRSPDPHNFDGDSDGIGCET
jgi:micrococcal nuclease